MDCPLVHGLSPVRPWSVHAQVCLRTPYLPAAVENIQEPRIAVPKGRQPGALGKRKKQKEDLSTERNASHHEVVAAAVSGDNSQLKGIHRAPKPRGRKRKATEDISSSQAPELRRGLRRKQGTSG